MKAEFLQPKCISSPSSSKKELLLVLFLFLVAKKERVSQNVPNPQCTNALWRNWYAVKPTDSKERRK
jgi:hypothetical protein